MIARLIILVALVLGLLLGGVALGAWLFGDTKAVEAQGGDQDWEMVQRNIAGAAAGGQSISSGLLRESDMFLYNKRTGKAYKYFPGCTSGQVQSD